MKSVITLLAVACLCSCAGISPAHPIREAFSIPPSEFVVTASVGDTLLKQGTTSTMDAVVFSSDWDNGKVASGAYRLVGTQQGFSIYRPLEGTTAQIQTFLGSPAVLAMNTKNELFYASYGGVGNLVAMTKISPESFKFSKASVQELDSFQQALIYTGKSGNTLRLSYREFSGDIARPAFTVDVTYDLSESKTITYKKAKLEIIEATNSSLTYKVLSNFN